MEASLLGPNDEVIRVEKQRGKKRRVPVAARNERTAASSAFYTEPARAVFPLARHLAQTPFHRVRRVVTSSISRTLRRPNPCCPSLVFRWRFSTSDRRVGEVLLSAAYRRSCGRVRVPEQLTAASDLRAVAQDLVRHLRTLLNN